jgi:hypothetical protein
MQRRKAASFQDERKPDLNVRAKNTETIKEGGDLFQGEESESCQKLKVKEWAP